MALFSFLKGRGDARSPAPKGPGAQPLSAGQVESVRVRARRRLIGAAVLVLAAVVGLPMLFESKPRPLAVDTPIEVTRPDGLPAVTVPPPRSAVGGEPAGVTPRPGPAASEPIITESQAEAGREVVRPPTGTVPDGMRPISPSEVTRHAEPPRDLPPSERPPEPKVADPKAKPASAKPEASKPERHPEPKPKDKGDSGRRETSDAARAKALLEGQDEAPVKLAKSGKSDSKADGKTEKSDKKHETKAEPHADKAATGGRFVIQVGAFSQSSSAEAAIAQVGKLGLKAYAQEVDTASGKRTRVRLGPFASREEADRAAARLKAGGQAAAVLPQ